MLVSINFRHNSIHILTDQVALRESQYSCDFVIGVCNDTNIVEVA